MKTKAIAGIIVAVFLASMVVSPAYAIIKRRTTIVTKNYHVTINQVYITVGKAEATLRIYSDKSFRVEVAFWPFTWPTYPMFYAQCAFLLGKESYSFWGSQDGSATSFNYFDGTTNYAKNIPWWQWHAHGYVYHKDWPGLLAKYTFTMTGKLTGDYTWTQLRLLMYQLGGGYQQFIRFGHDFEEVWY